MLCFVEPLSISLANVTHKQLWSIKLDVPSNPYRQWLLVVGKYATWIGSIIQRFGVVFLLKFLRWAFAQIFWVVRSNSGRMGWYDIQISDMIRQDSKNRSRCSSSSSGSMKLIHEHQIEKYELKLAHNRDLFDLLLDQNCDSSHGHTELLRTISQMNLSPRQQSHQGCKCSKIDCLKMYCECFSKGRLCNQRCQCNTCCNKEDCRLQIYKAQQLANFRHPGTFKGVPAWVPQRRCTCKKSGCRKNYCECYRAGIKCGEECQCLMCQNGKPHSHDSFIDSRMQIEVNA